MCVCVPTKDDVAHATCQTPSVTMWLAHDHDTNGGTRGERSTEYEDSTDLFINNYNSC